MISQELAIPVGASHMRAYLARPEEGSGAHPAVIVLQEVFGFTPEVKRITDLVASTGYTGLAINYYHRTHPHLSEPYTEAGSSKAFAAAAQVSKASLREDIAAAAGWLGGQDFVKPGKVATWGFGFGATAAFISATMPAIGGAICFYPGHVTIPLPNGDGAPLDDVAAVQAPILLCFGDKDYYVSRYETDRIGRALSDNGKSFRLQIYPDVGHSFFRRGRPEAIVEQYHYSDEAVAQAVADSSDLVKAFLSDAFNRP